MGCSAYPTNLCIIYHRIDITDMEVILLEVVVCFLSTFT